jgi:hypothetical protein
MGKALKLQYCMKILGVVSRILEHLVVIFKSI